MLLYDEYFVLLFISSQYLTLLKVQCTMNVVLSQQQQEILFNMRYFFHSDMKSSVLNLKVLETSGVCCVSLEIQYLES